MTGILNIFRTVPKFLEWDEYHSQVRFANDFFFQQRICQRPAVEKYFV